MRTEEQNRVSRHYSYITVEKPVNISFSTVQNPPVVFHIPQKTRRKEVIGSLIHIYHRPEEKGRG